MTSPTSTPRDTASLYHAASTSAFPALHAVAITAGAWATLIAVGLAAMRGGLAVPIAVALGQLGMLSVPVVAMRLTKQNAAVLGIARAPWQYLVAAVLIGTSAWYVNTRLVGWLEVPADTRVIEQLVDNSSLGGTLAALALAPAICEEVLFRGVLLRGLATRFLGYAHETNTFAIVLAAALFAGYHLTLVQLVPTFTLGCVFGLVALRAASVLPTMLAHFLNNALAIVISRDELPMLANREGTGLFDRNPTLTLAGAAALTVSGIAIACVAPRAPAPRTEGMR